MKPLIILAAVSLLGCAHGKANKGGDMAAQAAKPGCGGSGQPACGQQTGAGAATLVITWQRLVSGGATCPRCGETGQELDKAAATLTTSLAALGIAVKLEKGEITEAEFKQEPLRSNRILLNRRPIEEYLGGATGHSKCCDVCGPEDCRTVEVGGAVYETVPAELIVKAGLLAAAELVVPKKQVPCCGSK